MKNVWIICLMLLSPCSLTVNAQNVPGYLGKRFAVGYTAVMMPGFGINPGVNTSFSRYQKNFSILNYQHRLTSEFIVGKKWSLTGEVMLTKVAIDDDYHPDLLPYDWARGAVTGFVVGVRKYTRHLAPLSRFLGYKVGYYSVRTDPYKVRLGYEGSFSDSDSDFTIPGIQTGTAMFGFSVGTNRIVRDRAMLTFGFDFALLLQGRMYSNSILGINAKPSNEFNSEKPNSRQNIEQMENLALGRVFAESLLNFSIGLSFLP